jgi:hypothetical protein
MEIEIRVALLHVPRFPTNYVMLDKQPRLTENQMAPGILSIRPYVTAI